MILNFSVQGNWGICQRMGIGCPTSPTALINETAACQQGNIPSFYLDVRSVSDVQRALAFAKNHNISVIVKNSGHDYKGRSAGPGCLALWIYNYTPEPVFDKNFIPDGCTGTVGDVVTFGAGQGFNDVYAFAAQNNVTIVGGSSETVAPAGGWITGGGHSGLSPVYGLGVDNVQQLRVVLPNGTYVTANRCQNQDIFFALRGGGGGTFGVNMEMSTLAYPQLPIQWANVPFVNLNESMQFQLMTILVENANTWFDAGWGGYAYPARTAQSFPVTPQPFSVTLMNPRLNRCEAAASLAPLFAFAESLHVIYNLTTYSSFYDLYVEYIKNSLVMTGNYGIAQASRLIPRSNFEGPVNQTELVNTLIKAVTNTSAVPLSLMLLLVTPARDIQDSDSAITPAWRRSTWHVISATNWNPAKVTAAQIKASFRAVTRSMEPLRNITPGGGAYLNEGDTFEPDPVGAFWGDNNYQRLLQIKHELDPQNVMQVHGGIGWNPGAPLFSCYPKIYEEADLPGHALRKDNKLAMPVE
jgi:hypothetical protein